VTFMVVCEPCLVAMEKFLIFVLVFTPFCCVPSFAVDRFHFPRLSSAAAQI
jgi:hypothetical protein